MTLPTRLRLGALAVAALLAAAPAHAKCALDLSSGESMVRSSECFGFYFERIPAKKTGLPGRVAIVSFQVRFGHGPPTAAPITALDYGGEIVPVEGEGTHFFELAPEDYNRIASHLYDRFVDQLRSLGIEVLPVEAVMQSPTYKALKPDTAVLYKRGRYARATAHGLKSLKPRPVREEMDRRAGITRELKVDAVLGVFFSVGLITPPGSPAGRPSLFVGSSVEGPTAGSPLEIVVLGGVAEEKIPGGGVRYLPAWRARFGIQRASGTRLLYRDSLRPPAESGDTFSPPDYAANVRRYHAGVDSLFDVASQVALARWRAPN